MDKLIISALSIYSNKNNEGNTFAFSEGINIIESTRNSLGKSTLLNLIYWTLGCEIDFGQWQHCFCRVDFTLGNAHYSAYRTPNDIFHLITKGSERKFTQLGEYQQALINLWQVNIQLTNHNQEIKTARPAHFFATSYISQEKGWSEFFAPPFKHLSEFAKYKSPLVKQFTYKTPQYLIDLEKQKSSIEERISIQNNKKAVLEQTASTLNITLKRNNIITAAEDYARQISELQIKLDQLTLKRIETEERLKIIQAEKSNIEEDYKFALSEEREIICDKCGTVHQNGTLENANLSAYAAALAYNEEQYLEEKENLVKQTTALSQRIRELKQLHPKALEETVQAERNELIQAFTLEGITQIQTQITTELEKQQIKKEATKEELTKARRKNSKEQKEPNQFFVSRLKHYADKLGITLKYESIKSPNDYNKVTHSLLQAGAADKNRSILAYYLAIYEMAMQYGSCPYLPPLMIDTPMQNDQDAQNYKSILDVLCTQKNKQIFICLINDGSVLNAYSDLHRISLNKVLSAEKADEVRKHFERIL